MQVQNANINFNKLCMVYKWQRRKKNNEFRISKQGYEEHKIILGLDEAREKQFNEGKPIGVSSEELKAIGEHRWLEVKDGK